MTVSEEKFPSPEDFREIVVFTGCKSWVMDMAAMERYDTVINEQELNLLACARESLSGDAIKEILLMPQVIGFTALDISSQVPGDIAGINDCMALKDYLRSEGMEICLFESSISFEDFKLNSDGLIPVITQDYKTGKVLMMAYMNEESYNETIRSGRMTYFSRSRQCLWKKARHPATISLSVLWKLTVTKILYWPRYARSAPLAIPAMKAAFLPTWPGKSMSASIHPLFSRRLWIRSLTGSSIQKKVPTQTICLKRALIKY